MTSVGPKSRFQSPSSLASPASPTLLSATQLQHLPVSSSSATLLGPIPVSATVFYARSLCNIPLKHFSLKHLCATPSWNTYRRKHLISTPLQHSSTILLSTTLLLKQLSTIPFFNTPLQNISMQCFSESPYRINLLCNVPFCHSLLRYSASPPLCNSSL